MLDVYLRSLKALCKSEIYKDENDQLLDFWTYYIDEVCPVIANDLQLHRRYTGKFLFISMFLKADLGITVQ